jgi:hypothetical protein
MMFKKNGLIFLVIAALFMGLLLYSLYSAQGKVASSHEHNTTPNQEEDNLYNKIMCGYQGWFGAPGDDIMHDMGWLHWCSLDTQPTPETITIDAWPDYSEYPDQVLFYPESFDWLYPDGSKAGFYSSNLEETVLLHCKWMHDYGIDGVFLQRFTVWLTHHQMRSRYDNVLRHMLKGAEMYDLKVAVMYDISGTRIVKIAEWMINDWDYLVDVMRVTEHPCYLHHPDRHGVRRPVVAAWGPGFVGKGSIGQTTRIINFFTGSDTDPLYRATLVGGVPGYWRFGERDSKPGYELAFAGYDILSPWTVGRFRNESGVVNWRHEIIDGDIELTQSLGQGYFPVCFPGFSNYNIVRNKTTRNGTSSTGDDFLRERLGGVLNEIPRNGGHFMWTQFYQWRQAGARMLYVAMFDEVDEGTAIFKIAADPGQMPQPNHLFFSLDVDGYPLKSDFYLWLTGTAGFIIKRGFPFPQHRPVRLTEQWFNAERKKERAWIVGKYYGRIDITAHDAAVSRLTIYRKVNAEHFIELKTIQRGELQNGSYTLYDAYLLQDSTYTYLLVAFDSGGIPLGVSDRKTI